MARNKKKDGNIYYVYLHRKATDNEVFYVGKGKKKRAVTTRGRSQWWQRIVAKYGYTVEYVEKELSEDDAFDLEIELIKFYRETGHTLCNIREGGEGRSRERKDNRGINTHVLFKPESIAKWRELRCKPIICSNGMVFDSIADASRWSGVGGAHLGEICKRVYASGGGYVWRYLDDCDDLKQMLDKGLDAFVEWNCADKLMSNIIKKVYCSNGMVFDSIPKAVTWLQSQGCKDATINTVTGMCRGQRIKEFNGLSFSRGEDKFYEGYRTKVWKDVIKSLGSWTVGVVNENKMKENYA